MMRVIDIAGSLLRVSRLAVVVAMLAAVSVAAAAPAVDDKEFVGLGFKALVAATPAQQKWVQNLVPGKMRPMQRNGKKFFIYPDAARNQIFVGGPQEYEAYRKVHPESRPGTQEAADKGSAYRLKQDEVMRNATARDLSDPFLGVTWGDLGW